MLPEKRTNTNVGVGMGFLLQLAGSFLARSADPAAIRGVVLLGLVLWFIGMAVFVWGCMNWAEGKGYSRWIGLVGLGSIIGLILLIVLRDKERDGPPPSVRETQRWDSAAMITTLGLVLSLPFAISLTVMCVLGLIAEYEMAAGLIKNLWESPSAGWAEVFGILAACFFTLAVPGAILGIAGLVRRKTALAWITLAVVVYPWLLIGLCVAVTLLIEAR